MNREQVKSLLISLTGQANVIAIPRVFIELTGSLPLAAMLNQLIYWSDKVKRKDGYIYKSAKCWQEEIGAVTEYSIGKFKKLHYVITKLSKANGAPTTHYKIDFSLLFLELAKMQADKVHEMDLAKTRNPIRENTKSLTKTTTEIKDNLKDSTSHLVMVEALQVLTGLDMKIKSNAGRIVRAVKELRAANYAAADIEAFGKAWKKDWRYKQNKRPPALSTVLAEIVKGNKVLADIEDVINRRKKLALAAIEGT